ncbi:MAG: response regulator [Planctomycetaceae bacterium]|nr:response regulator [Planctomycetaceae bacterium]
MSVPYSDDRRELLRAKLTGFGDRSVRMSYYPQLQKKLEDIRRLNELLEQRVEQRTTELTASNVALNQEIRDRKKAEDSLQKALGELQRLYASLERRAAQLHELTRRLTQTEERERRQFARILHDNLQQILVAARMKLERFQNRTPAQRQEFLLGEVRNLLDEATAQSRSLTVELSPPVLYDAGFIAGLEWLARQTHERYGLAVQIEVDPEAASAVEDLGILLFHVIRELLFNVVKHAQAKHARVQLTRRGEGHVEIRVTDDGVGFDPQRLEWYAGNEGFGVFSIRERLEPLNGRLEIHSVPGEGTSAVIILPKARLPAKGGLVEGASRLLQAVSPEVLKVAPRAPAETAVACVRVLLADDHPILRKGLGEVLNEKPGIEVVGEAGDGEEAVEQALRLRPDVVLMDITMPRLNGIEATRRITTELPDVRVVGLSMHEGDDMANAMREAGAVAYLRKDEAIDTLVATILRNAKQPSHPLETAP